MAEPNVETNRTWTRKGPVETVCNRVAVALNEFGFSETGFNIDFAYDDDEARLFLNQDLDRITASWTGPADALEEIVTFAKAGPAR